MGRGGGNNTYYISTIDNCYHFSLLVFTAYNFSQLIFTECNFSPLFTRTRHATWPKSNASAQYLKASWLVVFLRARMVRSGARAWKKWCDDIGLYCFKLSENIDDKLKSMLDVTNKFSVFYLHNILCRAGQTATIWIWHCLLFKTTKASTPALHIYYYRITYIPFHYFIF